MSSRKCSICSPEMVRSQRCWTVKPTRTCASPTKSRSCDKEQRTVEHRTSSVPIRSFEDEYVKQLQRRIRYLESECLYLRSHSSLFNRTMTEGQLNEMIKENCQTNRFLTATSSKCDQLTKENSTLNSALQELRRKFDTEKFEFLSEIDRLKRTIEILQRDREIKQARISDDELKKIHSVIKNLEHQLLQEREQNRILNQEIDQLKCERGNAQRLLDDYQSISREKDRYQSLLLECQQKSQALEQHLKSREIRLNEIQLIHDRFDHENHRLIKENARLETLAKDFEHECEQLRAILSESIDQSKLDEKELIILRKKDEQNRITIENLETKLMRTNDLDEQLKQTQRQINIETEKFTIAQRQANDFELRNKRLEKDLEALRNDKNHLLDKIKGLERESRDQELLIERLRRESEQLEICARDIDRIKELEDLIRSQRWEEIVQMAQSMQTVSRSISKILTPRTLR